MRSSCCRVCASHRAVSSEMGSTMQRPWPRRRSAALLALVFLVLLFFSTSFAGRPCSSSVDRDALRQQREASSEAVQKKQAPPLLVVHARRMLSVKTNDYAGFDPSPAMDKPRSKIIPN